MTQIGFTPHHYEDDQQHDETRYDDMESGLAPDTVGLPMRHRPSYDEVANIAACAASDWAGE